jgi:HAD superfamily hydrolase (TIGR01490 family)
METISSKDSVNPKNYIVFFDLDQTITKSISGKELAKGAFRKGLLTKWDLFKAVLLSLLFRFNLRGQLEIIDDMVSWVKGIPEKTIIDLCNEVFHEVLLPSVYPEARSEIVFHRSGNAKVVILSSALTPICREMAKNLKMDDILCSDLEVKNGFMTGHPVGHLCFGGEKAVRLNEYCRINNFSPAEAWCYGDSASDLSALEAVGHPVCVNPDRNLKRTAIQRGWKILNWNI